MKKTILYIFFLIFFGSNGWGQCKLKYTVLFKSDIGPFAAVNINRIRGNSWEGNNVASLGGGVMGSVSVKAVGLSAGLNIFPTRFYANDNFNVLASKHFYNLSDTNKRICFDVINIKIPMYFLFRLNQKICLGPGIEYNRLLVYDKQNVLTNTRDIFKSSSINLLLGINFQCYRNIHITCNYSIGMRDIDKKTPSGALRQNTLSIGLRYSHISKFKWTVPSWLYGIIPVRKTNLWN